jgi:hypothetical protein
MIGLHSLGGHPQTVRPLLAPMAEAAAEAHHGALPAAERERLRALCAGTDNVGLFFGEDVFIAFGAVLLMQASSPTTGSSCSPSTSRCGASRQRSAPSPSTPAPAAAGCAAGARGGARRRRRGRE